MHKDQFLFDEAELKKALAEIIHRNSKKWVKIGRAILRNSEDAEDVLSESVRRMLTRGRSFSSQENMQMYLGRIVRNTAMEFYSRRKRERRQYVQALENIIAKSVEAQSAAFRPDLIMEEEERYAGDKDRLTLLRRGLEELPANQYEAIRLISFSNNGSTFRDAESASGIPRATLRYRYMQGMKALRKYMTREQKKLMPRAFGCDSYDKGFGDHPV
jgi:RNA polymerase sigma factor (sigma-70 family)